MFKMELPTMSMLDVANRIEKCFNSLSIIKEEAVLEIESEQLQDKDFSHNLLSKRHSADSDSEEDEVDLEESLQILEDPETEDEDTNTDNFRWSENFDTFRSQRENFQETPGPRLKGTNPVELFLQIWDQEIMKIIEKETNRYALQEIAKASEAGIPANSRWNKWVETTTCELYQLLTVLIGMNICGREQIDEYWETGVLEMPMFRELMTHERFMLLMQYLHFTDNEYSLPRGHPNRKHEKIGTLIDQLNVKFQEFYTPKQELAIAKSLLLRVPGQLRWVRSIVAFGHLAKIHQLCEAASGYCVKLILFTGERGITCDSVCGFTSTKAKILLNLMQGFLGKGYTVLINNFYNSIKLCRFLKRHKTDVVGPLNRRGIDTPQDINDLDAHNMARGDMVSQHCGDVSVVAQKNINVVTTVSTYHDANMTRAGDFLELVHTYNSFMSNAADNDQKLSPSSLESERNIKWYVKVFIRLMNVSILNAHVIHCANTRPPNKKLTHRAFKYELVEQLVERFAADAAERIRNRLAADVRLDVTVNHFPKRKVLDLDDCSAKTKRFKRGPCARCTRKELGKTSNVLCSSCNVFLCIGPCWREFHKLEVLE